MKKTIRIICVLMLMIALKINATAQVLVDGTNLLTRLEGVNALNPDDAQKYFADLGYNLSSKQTVAQPNYSMDLYKFKSKDKPNSYLLSVIAGGVTGSGYLTYDEDEYKAALKTIQDAGFATGEVSQVSSDQTVYAKDNLRFVIQHKTVNGKTFYVMMLSDLLKTAKLAGLKK